MCDVNRKHSPGCPCCEPFIECPARIRVRVRSYCSLGFVEGATVTAKDVAEVEDDVTELTGADGWAELEVVGPNTFDVHVTVGTCTEIIEGVELVECEVKELPDVGPCCGTVCFEVYDYDTGSPIAGAEVANGILNRVTDSSGIACRPPIPGQQFTFDSVTAPGYVPARGGMKYCFPCDCDEDQNTPVSMFPESSYVLGGAIGFVPDCVPEPDCLLSKTVRPFNVFKRIMTVDFSGPEAIFGSASSGVELTYDPGVGQYGAWVGWTSGGWGWKRTRQYVPGSPGFTGTMEEVDRERFDFPAARARVIARFSFDPGPGTTALEWQNFMDAGGTIPADWGHVFETSGTPMTPGYTVVDLVPELFCEHNGYPFGIRNDRAPAGTSTTGDLCDGWAFGLWSGSGIQHFQSPDSGMCAPVDVAGAFWCGFDRFNTCPYGARPTATYALYE
jgi:hypothetical protein